MISAGYNGWADAPEEEREGAEPFERDADPVGEMPAAQAEIPMLPATTPVPAPRRHQGDRAA